MIEILRGQIQAIRAQLDAMDRMLDGFSQQAPACAHPEEDWENLGTFGQPDFRCKACRAVITEIVLNRIAGEGTVTEHLRPIGTGV